MRDETTFVFGASTCQSLTRTGEGLGSSVEHGQEGDNNAPQSMERMRSDHGVPVACEKGMLEVTCSRHVRVCTDQEPERDRTLQYM